MSLPRINFLHLTVSEIQPGQTISRRPPARPDALPPDHPDTMGENNTPTALKGCGVKRRHAHNGKKLIKDVSKIKQKNKTTAVVCISRRVLQGKKYLLRDIHNFSFSAKIQDGSQRW